MFDSLKKARNKDGVVTADNIEEIVEPKRSLTGRTLLIVNTVAFLFACFQLYVAGFKSIDTTMFRAAHLGFGLFLTFMIYPMYKKASRSKVAWYDVILSLIALAPCVYIVTQYKAINARAGIVTTMDLIMGLVLILCVLEAARRVVGNVLTGIAAFFLLYSVYGNYFVGLFQHRGVSYAGLVRHMIFTLEGLFGTPLGASASFIFLFCLLGALMSHIGADSVLIDLAVGLFGRSVGGPAKASVVASALFGTISGSSLANVTTTGTFTIPMMKKVGYEPEFAGAVEAAASCGGQIMPPIMGATAFIMAEFVGTSYINVCLAAAIPAALYYIAIFVSVHQKAVSLGLKGLPAEELPNVKEVLKKRGYLLLPLLAIVVFLVMGFSPSMSGFVAIAITIVVSWFKKESRLTPKKLFVAFADGAKGSLGVIIACAVVGFISGSFTLTGLGLKLASIVTQLARGNLFLTLLFAAIASLILGMGVPTTANYIVVSMICVPVVVKMGVPTMAAHLFCFYYGIVSDLTPPVALGALAGAGLAKAKFLPTAINATKLGIAAYIVPFFFVYNPVLLLGETPFGPMVVLQCAFAIIGIFGICSGFYRQFLRKMNAIESVVILVAGLLTILPEIYTSLIGTAVMVAFGIYQIVRDRKNQQTTE